MPRQSLSDDYRADAKIFGQQVRRRREDHGWTQEEMVARMDGAITRNHLQDIERGAKLGDGRPTNPQLSTFIALGRALGSRIVIDVNRPSGFVVRFDPEAPPANEAE